MNRSVILLLLNVAGARFIAWTWTFPGGMSAVAAWHLGVGYGVRVPNVAFCLLKNLNSVNFA